VWVMVAEDLSVLNATLLNVLHPFNVFVCLYFVVFFTPFHNIYLDSICIFL